MSWKNTFQNLIIKSLIKCNIKWKRSTATFDPNLGIFPERNVKKSHLQAAEPFEYPNSKDVTPFLNSKLKEIGRQAYIKGILNFYAVPCHEKSFSQNRKILTLHPKLPIFYFGLNGNEQTEVL